MTNKNFEEKTAELDRIIKPVRKNRYEVRVDWRHFPRYLKSLAEDYGPVELNPDFQRGHVWTEEQQVRFIENVMRGIASSASLSIQLNCSNWNTTECKGDLPIGIQCLDGLQRINAVSRFLGGEIHPFGLTLTDLEGSSYSVKLSNFYFTVQMFDYENKTDVIQHYIDFNAGGTPHAPEEIERIKKLKADIENESLGMEQGMRM
jgi:hypothetical protein